MARRERDEAQVVRLGGVLYRLEPVGPGLAKAPALPTFGDLAQRFLESTHARDKPSTRENKRACFVTLSRHVGAVPIDQLTRPRLTALQAALLASGLAPRTVNLYLTKAQAVLAWAATDLELIDAVPYIRKLSVRDEPRTVTREHYEALVRETSGQMRTMLLLAGDAGLRIGEVVALEWRCVTARGLCVCATNWRGHVGTPKSGRTRLVPLTARLRGELDGLPRELATVVRFVPTSWVVRVLDPICARLKIARVTLHACRHSFASELARRGVALGTIRDLLGHSNVATTDRYLHTEPEQLAEAVAALDVPGGRVL